MNDAEPSVTARRTKRTRTTDPSLHIKVLWPALIAAAWHSLRRGGWRLLAVYVATQLLVLAIALPVIQWLFREALQATGLRGVDLSALRWQTGTSVSIALIALILVVALWAVAVQLTILVLAVRQVRLSEEIRLRVLLRDLGGVVRKLSKPSSLGLLWYLFLVLPLAQFGFFSALTHGISVPSFITGELTKSMPGIVGYVVFIVAAAVINIRLALTLPLFALSNASGARSMRLSWRLTGRVDGPFQLACMLIFVTVVALGMLLALVALAPTMLSDLIAPGVSVAVAAISLATAQIVGVLISGFATISFVAISIELLWRRRSVLPDTIQLRELAPAGVPTNGRAAAARPAGRWQRNRGALMTTAVIVTVGAVLAVSNVPLMRALDQSSASFILAHRGFSKAGVENTISGLQAAADAGADAVEMDVMQTSDGQFVVMHDASLTRLADRPENVGDLTLDELTVIEVHDLDGHRDLIPSLEDYLMYADKIGMPLLIEIKPHGGETPDVVQLLVDELERLDVLEDHLYHSLDKEKVEELKRLRPSLTVGYTMAAAGVAAPITTVDFIVVEEFSYNQELHDDAEQRGLGMMVWTVNDEPKQRQLFRSGVDGIITDRPDIAVAAREKISAPGLSEVLRDALTRFVILL